MKKMIALVLGAFMVLTAFCAVAEETEDPYPFVIREAIDDGSNRVALSMDDCFDLDMVKAALDICVKHGVTMTFFPLGKMILPEDRELWQSIIDAGCEIGSHSFYHKSFANLPNWDIIGSLGKTQQALDAALGYHYQIRWLRPPYGNIAAAGDSAGNRRVVGDIKLIGYNHVVKWNVSQTDPKKAIKEIKPGAIALFHARQKDVNCLDTIIPQLLEKGMKPVTLSELLGYGPPETGDELYVYNKADYQK